MADEIPLGLEWNGTSGYAARNGKRVGLSSAPRIAGKPVAQISYIPSIGVASIRRSWEHYKRTMQAHEASDARAIVEALL
jgi:hypothetical protein